MGRRGRGVDEVLDAGEEEGDVSDPEWACSRAGISEALVGEKRRGGGRRKRGRGRGRVRGKRRGRGRGRGDAHQETSRVNRLVTHVAMQ